MVHFIKLFQQVIHLYSLGPPCYLYAMDYARNVLTQSTNGPIMNRAGIITATFSVEAVLRFARHPFCNNLREPVRHERSLQGINVIPEFKAL